MVDYSYLSDQLLGAVRSLNGYGRFAQFLRRNRCKVEKMRSAVPSFRAIGIRFNCNDFRDFATQDDVMHFWRILDKYGIDTFLEGCKAVHNAYMRTTRVRQRIQYMRENFDRLYFVTFTIADMYIDKYSDDLKNGMDLVKRTLNSCSSVWVFNSDYGDKRGRLHWHACCPCDIADSTILKSLWPLGMVDVKVVGFDDADERKIARYQTKLARHAVKQSAFKVCYSRLKKKK